MDDQVAVAPSPAGTATRDPAPPAVAIEVQGLSLRGPYGFADVTFRARPGDLVVVTGDSDAARAGLLLALTGRLGPVTGLGLVGGSDLARQARQVRRCSAVARIGGAIEPDPWDPVSELTHGVQPVELLGERLAALDGDLCYRELSAPQRVLLLTCLALACAPGLVVLDGADRGCDTIEAGQVWRLLGEVASAGVTVVASTAGAPHPARGENVLVKLTAPLSYIVDGR